MSLGVYAFEKVIVSVGPIRITGFADGEGVITADHVDDLYGSTAGNDGDAVAEIYSSRKGAVTLTLLQSSLSNVYLAGVLAAQRMGVFLPIAIKDLSNLTELAMGPNCIITKAPPLGYGRKQTSREWVIDVPELIIIPGGQV